MRPMATQRCPSCAGGQAARLAMFALVQLTSVAVGPVAAQPVPQRLPTAIISSGAVPPETATSAMQAGDRVPPQSPWTAEQRPQSLPLRPAGTPELPSADFLHSQATVVSPAVVTASATDLPAAAHSTDSSAGRHLPLAPPSSRFTGETAERGSSTSQLIVSVGSSLLLVVGLFLGIVWFYRRTLGTPGSGGLPKQVVQVLGRSSISPRQQLVLLRFGHKLLLVSNLQGESRTLAEISDPVEVDRLLGLCESGQSGSITNSFKSVLLQESV